MSLKTVSNLNPTSLTQDIPSTATKSAQQLNSTVDNVTTTATSNVPQDVPGSFPKDTDTTQTPSNENNVTIPSLSSIYDTFRTWFSNLVPSAVDLFESSIKRLVLWLLPPPRQALLYEAALSHPIAATFVACQLICCGVPLILFLAGTLVFAAVAILVWAVLSAVILGPIVLVASMMGVSLWGWGWVVFGLVKWVDRLFLGGVLSRYWLSGIQLQKDEQDSETREEKTHQTDQTDQKDQKGQKEEVKAESGGDDRG